MGRRQPGRYGRPNSPSPRRLRRDPLLTLTCDRLTENGAELASQATCPRLENAADRPACYRLAVALFAVYAARRSSLGSGTSRPRATAAESFR